MDKVTDLTMDLIRFKSITPNDDGIIEFIAKYLTKLGFTNTVKTFSSKTDDGKDENVLNLYSEIEFLHPSNQKYQEEKDSLNKADKVKNLCFAGHVDVVHPGKEFKWTFPPFEPTISDGILYGRGVSDMKAAIAAFIIACEECLPKLHKEGKSGKISFLITADEEGRSVNGTKKMIEYISSNGTKIDDCIVGEPTNVTKIGDTIKIGRRGSATFSLELTGKQGHIAYKENFINPITYLGKVITALKLHKFDEGSEFFEPSNLEFFSINADNIASNVVPGGASAGFNIRFCDSYDGQNIAQVVKQIITKELQNTQITWSLKHSISGESFLGTSKNSFGINCLINAVSELTDKSPTLSSSGGTSDARFITNYTNVFEFGMINATAHQIDERELVSNIILLKNIYKQFVIKYFQ